MNQALSAWKRLESKPFGKTLFSRFVCFRAPYFATISPRFEELRPGFARVSMKKRRGVTNHIGTVHAIAMCNLAELVGGLGTDVSGPRSMRWIPKGMRVSYLAKASGTLHATATIPAIDEAAGACDIEVPVVVEDPRGTRVFEATITMWVSPRKG